MPFSLVRDDIAHVDAQVLVAPANEALIIDGGAGFSIAQKLGLAQLQAACQPYVPVATGQVAVTPVDWMESSVRYVFHAVGPVWQNGGDAQEALLAFVYQRIFQQALDLGVDSIAVPLISTGARECPAQTSFDVAFRTLQKFLQENDTDLLIILVLFGSDAVTAASRYVADIRCEIDDAYEAPRLCCAQPQEGQQPSRFGRAFSVLEERVESLRPAAKRREDSSIDFVEPCFEVAAAFGGFDDEEESLEALLTHIDAGFSDTLLRLIEAKGLTDAQVYKKANVSRQHFSKIRSDAHYQPTKKTVFAFCIALELSLEASEDLLARAGFAFSPSLPFDKIVRYFIVHNEYDIFIINGTLYELDQPLLG